MNPIYRAFTTTQDVTHQLNSAIVELQSSKSTWFQKTLTSISSLKERTATTNVGATYTVTGAWAGTVVCSLSWLM